MLMARATQWDNRKWECIKHSKDKISLRYPGYNPTNGRWSNHRGGGGWSVKHQKIPYLASTQLFRTKSHYIMSPIRVAMILRKVERRHRTMAFPGRRSTKYTLPTSPSALKPAMECPAVAIRGRYVFKYDFHALTGTRREVGKEGNKNNLAEGVVEAHVSPLRVSQISSVTKRDDKSVSASSTWFSEKTL